MPDRFQSAVIGSSLYYPNAVVWSEQNLVAVASGDVVVIMNPSNLRVRGVISIPSSKPFPVGVIDEGEGLLDGCLLPRNLSRETLPFVSCLISICTAGGRVKLYCSPFCEFSAKWIEAVDISEMLYNYLKKINFGQCDLVSPEVTPRQDNMGREYDLQVSSSRKDQKRRRRTTATVAARNEDNLREKSMWQIVPASAYEGETLKKSGED